MPKASTHRVNQANQARALMRAKRDVSSGCDALTHVKPAQHGPKGFVCEKCSQRVLFITSEARERMHDEVRKEALPVLRKMLAEYPQPADEGNGFKPSKEFEARYHASKFTLYRWWMEKHCYTSRLIVVDFTQEEMDIMAEAKDAKEAKTQDKPERENRKSEKVQITYKGADGKTMEFEWRKGCAIHRIFELLNLKQPLTVDEIAERIHKAFPEKELSSITTNVKNEIAFFRAGRNLHVGRDERGRYSVHIEEMSRSRVLSPEALAEKKEKEKARAARADERAKAKAEKAKLKEKKSKERSEAKEKKAKEKAKAKADAKKPASKEEAEALAKKLGAKSAL